jgi:3-hydroxyisobutyrate dehydrogenase-like beta-hydroxyacid dehydrogenase
MVSTGAGNSRIFELRAPMMVADRYDNATMKMSVWQKDMQVIGDYARQIGCPIPMFSATLPVYVAAMKSGHANEDTAAVCAVLEAKAGLKRKGTRAKKR